MESRMPRMESRHPDFVRFLLAFNIQQAKQSPATTTTTSESNSQRSHNRRRRNRPSIESRRTTTCCESVQRQPARRRSISDPSRNNKSSSSDYSTSTDSSNSSSDSSNSSSVTNTDATITQTSFSQTVTTQSKTLSNNSTSTNLTNQCDFSSTTEASPCPSLSSSPNLPFHSSTTDSCSLANLRHSTSLFQFSPVPSICSVCPSTHVLESPSCRLPEFPVPASPSFNPYDRPYDRQPLSNHNPYIFNPYYYSQSPFTAAELPEGSFPTLPRNEAERCSKNDSDSDFAIEVARYGESDQINHSNNDVQAPALLGSIVLLGFLNIFLDTALSSSVIPILPRELKQDEFHEAIIIGSGAVTATLFGPICGWLSDSCGWAPILMWFYPLVFTSSVLMLSARKSFGRFLIARFIAGAGSGFMYPSNLSMVVATHQSKFRSSAVGFTLGGDIGSLISPIVSGYLYDLGGLTLVFSVLIALSVIATIVFMVFIVLPSLSSSTSFLDCFNAFGVNRASAAVPTAPSLSSPLLPPHGDFSRDLSEPFLSLHSTPSYHTSPCPTPCPTPASPTPTATTNSRIVQRDLHAISARSRRSIDKLIPTPSAAASTREPWSDTRSAVGLGHSPSLRPSASFSMPLFTHGSPPPPYLFNLRLKKPPVAHRPRAQPDAVSVPSPTPQQLERRGFYAKFRSTLENLKMFSTVSFMSRCVALYYCWGLALSLQSILPIIWDRRFNMGPTRIGLLFAPHLVLRVVVSAFSPFFSDVTSTPLHTLISLGLFVCTCATAGLALLPDSASPLVHSLVVGLVGMGLGFTDSCATAWGGGAEFVSTSSSSSSSSSSLINSDGNGIIPQIDGAAANAVGGDSGSEAYRGRAFALLALACDLGMFTVPLVASLLSQYASFGIAFGVLSGVGLVVFSLSIYCGRIEAKAELEAAAQLAAAQLSTPIHFTQDIKGFKSNSNHHHHNGYSTADSITAAAMNT